MTKYAGMGIDVRISETAVFRRPHLATIGNHVAIDEFFVASTRIHLGDYVHIGPHVAVIGGEYGLLQMGNFTNISVGGIIVCGSDAFKGDGIVSAPGIPEQYRDTLTVEPVVFEDFANTGARVTILPGVTLPQGVVIGASSLVRKRDILEPWTIYAGNPLKKIAERNREHMLAHAQAMGYPSKPHTQS